MRKFWKRKPKKPLPELKFIGYYDRAGRKMKEGDIVTKKAFNTTEINKYIVCWEPVYQEWFYAVAKKTLGYLYHYPDLRSGEYVKYEKYQCEIIGSIYEDPDKVSAK